MQQKKKSHVLERLLNIREAAEFLNVSEMTVRRWTNEGSLRCYRIGGKRERRFTIGDLQDYIMSGTGPDERRPVSLGFGGLEAPDGSHMTHLYLDAAEAIETGASYILEGLKNHETVLVVAPTERTDAFIGRLQKNGADVEGFRRKNMLEFSEGMDDPLRQAAFISKVASSGEGRFRLLGDMMWARNKGWPLEALRDLEEMAPPSHAAEGQFFLCQYPLSTLSGEETMMSLETHSHTVFRGVMKESPYFRPS
jgi:transcriptional repressor of dcmA and dcmR